MRLLKTTAAELLSLQEEDVEVMLSLELQESLWYEAPVGVRSQIPPDNFWHRAGRLLDQDSGLDGLPDEAFWDLSYILERGLMNAHVERSLDLLRSNAAREDRRVLYDLLAGNALALANILVNWRDMLFTYPAANSRWRISAQAILTLGICHGVMVMGRRGPVFVEAQGRLDWSRRTPGPSPYFATFLDVRAGEEIVLPRALRDTRDVVSDIIERIRFYRRQDGYEVGRTFRFLQVDPDHDFDEPDDALVVANFDELVLTVRRTDGEPMVLDPPVEESSVAVEGPQIFKVMVNHTRATHPDRRAQWTLYRWVYNSPSNALKAFLVDLQEQLGEYRAFEELSNLVHREDRFDVLMYVLFMGPMLFIQGEATALRGKPSAIADAASSTKVRPFLERALKCTEDGRLTTPRVDYLFGPLNPRRAFIYL